MIASEGLPIQTATRVLGVSESGFYEWRNRRPSTRSIRHAWLTDMIRQVHAASRGTYGAPRVHAELTMGYGIKVGHNTVEMLMRRAGLKGLPGSRRPRRRIITGDTADDLVDRNFARTGPDQLWVTDITEHRTREGKIYCAVVLDCVQPPDSRMVDRLVTDVESGHLCTGDGNQQPEPETDGDPFRSRHSVHLMGVHTPGPPIRTRPLDGIRW